MIAILFGVIGLFIGGLIGSWPGAITFGIIGLVIGALVTSRNRGQRDALVPMHGQSGASGARFANRESALEDPAALRSHVWALTREVAELETEVKRLRGLIEAAPPATAAAAPPAADAPLPAATVEPTLEATPIPDEAAVAVPLAPAAGEPMQAAPESVPAPSMPESAAEPAAAWGRAVQALPEPVRAAVKLETAEPDSPAPEPSFLSRLLAGNIVAKLGVVILFFGVGFLLKFAYDYGMMPPELRVLGTAAAAAAMFFIGWRLQAKRRLYGLILQGGASGLAYLDCFFALKTYGFISPTIGFALFTALGVATTFTAVRQDAVVLAVLGLVGAFLAPILASTGKGSHVLLFSYYLLLNLFILGVSWFKSWRVLNLTGFIFTFIVGLLWGMQFYRPELFNSVEPFVLAFFAIYVVIPVLFATRQPPELKGLVDGTLVFGVPAAVAVMQAGLVRNMEYGLAFSAAGAAGVYALLAFVMHRRETMRLLAETYAALSLGLATLAVFFGFDAYPTFAIWTLEGSAIIWVGLRQNRPLARAFGMLVQLAGAVLFLTEYATLARSHPVLNDAVYGCVFVTVAGLFTARLLRSHAERLGTWEAELDTVALLWAAAWWSLGGLDALHHGVSAKLWPASMALFFTASALVAEVSGSRLQWATLRRLGLALPLALLVATAAKANISHDPLSDLGLFAWPIGFAAAFWIIHRQERDGIALGARPAYAATWILLAALATWEEVWLLSNRDYLDCMTLALAGHAAAYLRYNLRERDADSPFRASNAVLLWSAFFWFAATLGQAEKHLSGGELIAAMLGVVALSVLAYELAGSILRWDALRRGATIAWIAMPAAAAGQFLHGVHPLAAWGWLAWPAILAVSLWVFRRQEIQAPVPGATLMRGLSVWLPVALATIELVWRTGEWDLGRAWHTAAYCLPAALMLLAMPTWAHNWPVRGNERTYRNGLLWPLYLLVAAWLLYANVRSPGAMSPLPYLPLANPLDATVALALYAALRLRNWNGEANSSAQKAIDWLLALFGFFWINAIALRSIHFWSGVPYRIDALMASVLVQATFSLLWAGTAMALMIAARRQARRALWATGAVLLGVVVLKLFLVDLANSGTIARIVSFTGVGGLLLAIGYLAPVPPGTKESEGKN
jgi:uncharacterized membrane protein